MSENSNRTTNLLITLAMPAFLLVAGVLILLSTLSMEPELGVFPRIVSILMIVVALFDIVFELRKQDIKNPFRNSRVLMSMVYLLVLVAYTYALPKVGYIISTILVSFYTMYVLGYRNWNNMIISAVGITAVSFLIFGILLKVPLPTVFLEI